MPTIDVIVGKDKYPTDNPTTLGTSIAPLIVAGSLEVVIALANITGEINVYALSWDADCEKWYPLEKLICNERTEPPLIGRNRFAGIDVPTDRYVCLYAPGVKSTDIDACYTAYTPTALLNLASPPPIGNVTPNTIAGTTITATTEFLGPLGISAPAPARTTTLSASTSISSPILGLLTGSAPAPVAGRRQVYSPAPTTITQMDAAGNQLSQSNDNGASTTANIDRQVITATLGAMGASPKSIVSLGAGGHLIISTLVSGAPGQSALFNFSADGFTSLSGLAPTDFDDADTAGNLCVYKGGPGVVEIKWNKAGAQPVLIEVTQVLSM